MLHVWWYCDGATTPEAVPIELLDELTESGGGLLWMEAQDPTDPALDHIAEILGISDFALEDLRNARQRTKLAHYRGHVHLALHDSTLGPSGVATRELDIVVGEGWLLSVQQPTEDAAEPFPTDLARRRFELQRRASRAADEGMLLWAILDVAVDRAFAVTEGIDDELDRLEPLVFSEQRADGTSRQIFGLRRGIVDFRRAVAPLREVVGALLRREVPFLDEAVMVELQDLYDHVLRVVDLVESQREVLTGLLEAGVTAASNRMNRAMQTISAWGAILIVATLITGVLGMNFRNSPSLDWHWGFLAVLGVMVLAGLPLYVVFKRRRWL